MFYSVLKSYLTDSVLRDGLGDPYDHYKRKVKKALNECLKRLPPDCSPSELVHSPKKQAELLGGNKPLIHMGWPGGVPATIFNPALAALQQRLDRLEQVQVRPREIERAAWYISWTVKFHEDEAILQIWIKDLLNIAIGQNGEWGRTLNWADDIQPTSAWWYKEFLTLVLELKNTSGLFGDALLQAVMNYSKVVSRKKYERFRGSCNFPIVLIGATANRLEISVAVCVGHIYVTKLLTLDLSLGFHCSDNVIRLARVFNVLSSCRTYLENYYHKVSKLEAPRLSAGQPTSALVDLGNTTSALYIATLGDTDQEAILHFCERVIGDLFMVVMDRVDGKSIWQLQRDKMPVPAIISKKVAEAVRILHENDIVFGDLRDPNILYVASRDDMVLVDFDWPGKDGESRYPASFNQSNTWDDEVFPYGIMRKSHDLWQLKRLEALCNPGAE
ncbi:hypothetical protein NLJ89_g4547 [Agrocybe chaxingu]|uniref:Protein kinase domain-containing protein n=1 Tax=Agrocybe chaxingu TaxID=84603 RepID=A0A9W8K2P7_9AGAR|nr:hypothetical protein NLJ89_g4547 [Agrocybe chaxingu]